MLLTLAVREIVAASARARIVRLDLGDRSFPYRPGEAVLLSTPDGGRRRAFSLADGPEHAMTRGCLELLIGGDAACSDLRLEPGARLAVEGPIGSLAFRCSASERRLVFVAGGTGIAPLRAMWRQAMAVSDADIHVFYSVRTAEDFVYRDELHELDTRGRISAHLTVTRGHAGDGWAGHRGHLGLEHLQPLAGPETRWFVCGPRPMVLDVQRHLASLGVSVDQIVVDDWCRLALDGTSGTREFVLSSRSGQVPLPVSIV